MAAKRDCSDPSPSDFARWEALLETGAEPSEAAASLGFTCSAFRRASTERHAAALNMSREARGYHVDRRMEELAMGEDPSPHVVISWAKRHNPAYRDRSEVHLAGVDGNVLEVRVVHDEERATRIASGLVALGVIDAGTVGLGRGDQAGAPELDPARAA